MNSQQVMKDPSASAYEFDQFRLDPVERALRRRDGTLIPLTPRVFATLSFLVQHRDTILDKDRIMAAVWPDSIVEENNLSQNISTLRRVLGEKPGSPRFIVTVPGRGYRFAAEVKPAPATATFRDGGLKSLAVLPFKPLLLENRDAVLEMGMADTLIARLSTIRQLVVRPLSSVRRFAETEQEPLVAGRELGVGTVLDGSIHKQGENIRVTVRLLNTADGVSLWGGTFQEKLTDIFDVQDRIAEKMARTLTLHLSDEEQQRLTKRDTESAEAYQLYLKGRYFWWKGGPEEFRKSRDYFHRAVEVDPSYALGYCGLNSFYGFGSAWGILPPAENWPKALAANAKALELDNTLVQARTNQGAANMVYHRDFAAAEREIKQAIELNPRFEEVHYLYSFFLNVVGRFDEAITEARRALELDPFSIRFLQALGDIFYYARRYDEAVAQYRMALELEPNNPPLHEALGDVLERKGLKSEAVAEWHRATKLAGDDELTPILDLTNDSNRDFDSVLRSVTKKKLERLNARNKGGDYIPAIEYARAYLRLGEKQQTLRWLAKAADERNVFALLIGVDPFYDGVRQDRRFTAVFKQIGLPLSREQAR